jgi:hypothetical protein
MSVSEARPYTTIFAELDDAVEYRGIPSTTMDANTDQATANHEAVRCFGKVMRSPHQMGIGKRLSLDAVLRRRRAARRVGNTRRPRASNGSARERCCLVSGEPRDHANREQPHAEPARHVNRFQRRSDALETASSGFVATRNRIPYPTAISAFAMRSSWPGYSQRYRPHPGRGPVKLSGLEIQQRSAALRINWH